MEQRVPHLHPPCQLIEGAAGCILAYFLRRCCAERICSSTPARLRAALPSLSLSLSLSLSPASLGRNLALGSRCDRAREAIRKDAMKLLGSPWTRFYSNSCCLCCHVRTGTIILGIWYLILNAVVLLIILSALTDPGQYHLAGTELSNDFEFMDDANMCIATAVSLLMILICAMATYGAYKQHAAWIIPFFCYQIFDFALNTLVAISILVYPNTVRDYLQQLPANFPYKEEIMSMNSICLIVILLLCLSITLAFKAYLISCVWNCYRYINNRNNSDVLVYITTNDTAVLLPSYDNSANDPGKDAPPPPYVAA